MGLKLSPPPIGSNNEQRRFDSLVYQALVELDKRSSSQTASTDKATSAAIAALTSRIAALETEVGVGGEASSITLTATGSVSALRAVTNAGTQASNASAGDAGHVVGLALGDAIAGAQLTVAVEGQTVDDDAWTWTTGQLLWLGATGELATGPGTGAFAQPIALALTATSILIMFGEPIIAPSSGPFVTWGASFRLELVDAGDMWSALGLGSAAGYSASAFAPEAPANGIAYVRKDNAWVAESGSVGVAGACWDSAVAIDVTNAKPVDRYMPDGGTIKSVTVIGYGGPSSCTLDIYKAAIGSFPPTSSICGSSAPAIASGNTYSDAALTGWITTISAGDVLRFVLISNTTFKRVTVILGIDQP